MTQDTRWPQSQLYDIAHQAQTKAVEARRRRLKRRARTVRAMHPDGNIDVESRHRHAGNSLAQRRGMRGEEKAAQYLQGQGLSVLARNIHCRTGEIDLVVTDDSTLIFVEVRLRKSDDYGGGAASVGPAKQQRLVRTARFFLPRFSARYFGGMTPPCRFDVISINDGHLNWIRHAFEAI